MDKTGWEAIAAYWWSIGGFHWERSHYVRVDFASHVTIDIGSYPEAYFDWEVDFCTEC